MLSDPIQEPPPLVEVSRQVDGVVVQMPRRRRQTWIPRWVFLAVSLSLYAALVIGPMLLLSGGQMMRGQGLLLMLSLFSLVVGGISALVVFTWLDRRWFWEHGSLRFNQQMLWLNSGQRGPVEIPLASIRSVRLKLDRTEAFGRIEVHASEKIVSAFDGHFQLDLEWVRDLIVFHAERHRRALLARGEDPNAVVQPPAPLQEMRDR
ncbi:MAG: hypothetical protein AAFV53_15375 [Myxococcota bacterium]